MTGAALTALEAALAPYRARSNREIDGLLDAHEATRGLPDYPSTRTTAANRRIFGAGKRYRYAIACLVYQGLTGSEDFELPARPAAWLELYHVYTLFLDDIMDEDERRRTVPSAWLTNGKAYREKDAAKPARVFRTVRHRYGVSLAILDALRVRSLAERAIQTGPKVDIGIREQLLEILTETDLRLSDGQGLDIDFETSPRISEEDYARMSDLKTGVLYVAAAKTGALLAGVAPDRSRFAEDYARRFAWAFQDRDDLLGSGVVPSRIGGSKQGDIEKGKRTRLFALAIARMPPKERSAFLAAYGRGAATTAKDVKRVRAAFRTYALEEANRRIQENVERAIAALRAASITEPHRGILESLARGQQTRTA
ncbi:MAG TPA: polyprenyl synthetase family protein [Thermoplasmata archaeon]|nr:polyprenyl synthetase family protein [Thermoplasmata archaeon]